MAERAHSFAQDAGPSAYHRCGLIQRPSCARGDVDLRFPYGATSAKGPTQHLPPGSTLGPRSGAAMGNTSTPRAPECPLLPAASAVPPDGLCISLGSRIGFGQLACRNVLGKLALRHSAESWDFQIWSKPRQDREFRFCPNRFVDRTRFENDRTATRFEGLWKMMFQAPGPPALERRDFGFDISVRDRRLGVGQIRAHGIC